ncbi:DUF262 domain-containing protein [Aquisphaera insulae]|uniref:DUF262 domain-containing protein n=1 Tax=Aquisphaera insulae TaxID=2712864 RepID=UPI0013EB3F10|nr:DUF262 domain-containing protein [Aquisphaera insulae]
MKVENGIWTVQDFLDRKGEINPKPQYQRGEVWKLPEKQLLIDSILNGFDIPKIYLNKISSSLQYEYDVADGQQRLIAIWNFCENEYQLGVNSRLGPSRSGHAFKDLKKADRDKILAFKLVTAVVTGATSDEIRELFSRLQKGQRLTPAEFRNSMPSVLGDIIRAMAATQPFFQRGDFDPSRYKTDDLIAHLFALELYDAKRDLKAPTLELMYREHAAGAPQEVLQKVNQILAFMDQMQDARPGCINTKWGLVDLYWLMSKHLEHLPQPVDLADRYLAFEQLRKRYNADPSPLIEGESDKERRSIYDYIIAFKTSGGIPSNITTRHRVFSDRFVTKTKRK